MAESKQTTKEKFDEKVSKVYWGADWVQKFTPIEPDHKRVFLLPEKCDIELLGVELCMLHNSDPDAHKTVCKREMDDMFECKTNFKKNEQILKLQKASRQAGDRIPFTGFGWRY